MEYVPSNPTCLCFSPSATPQGKPQTRGLHDSTLFHDVAYTYPAENCYGVLQSTSATVVPEISSASSYQAPVLAEMYFVLAI